MSIDASCAFWRQVVLDDVAAALGVGRVDLQRAVEAARSGQRRVEHFRTVGRADHEDQRLVRDRAADDAEPAQDLAAPAVLDELAQRVHLVEERVEAVCPAEEAHAHAHAGAAALVAAAAEPDRIDLVHEHDAGAALALLGVFAGEAAGIAKQLHDHHLGHAHEHAADRAGVDVDERQVRLRRDACRQERLAGARPAREEQALGHFAAPELELLDALQDAHRALGVLQEVRLAAVVLEPHGNLRVIRRDGVLARPRQEPHQDAELEDQVEGGERQADRQLREATR